MSLTIDLSRSRQPLKLLDALLAADVRIAERERLAFEASLAPPVVLGEPCPCGSVFEVRGEPTADDLAALEEWEYMHADCGDES